MNFRTTTLLFGLLLGVLFTFGLMLALRKSALDEGFVMPKFAKATKGGIDYVEIANSKDSKKYTFTRKDKENWWLKVGGSDQEVRVETKKVDDLIEELRGARHSPDETDINRDLTKWKLNDPTIVVTLKDSTNATEGQFNVGSVSEDNAFVYCNSSERKRDALAVRKVSINSVFFKDINDFRSRRLLDATEQSAKRVDLKENRDGKLVTVLALEKVKDKNWKFLTPAYGPAELMGSIKNKGEQSVSALLSAIASMRAEEFEPIGGLQKLDEKNAILVIELQSDASKGGKKDAKSQTETLLIGAKLKETKDVPPQYFAKLVGDTSVVRVGAKLVDPVLALVKNPKALRSRDMAQFDPEDVDAIELVRGKEVVKLFRSRGEWKVYPAEGSPREGNETAIAGPTGLLGALQGRQDIGDDKDFVDTDTPEKLKDIQAKFAPEKIAAKAVVWVDAVKGDADPIKEAKKDDKKGDKKDDKKDPVKDETKVPTLKDGAKPTVTLSFVVVSDDKTLVQRETPDGQPLYFYVPAKTYDKAIPKDMAVAFFGTLIPTFSLADATKLEIVRGSKTSGEEKFIVEKELPKDAKKDDPKKDDPKKGDTKKETGKDEPKKDDGKKSEWQLVEPKGFKGSNNADTGAVINVLRSLAPINAQRWVGKVAKAGLGEFELDSPTSIVTVVYKKKEGEKDVDKSFVLKLGKKSAQDSDKDGVYAVEEGSDLVFVLPSKVAKVLKDAEFRDRQVLKFDSTQVSEVKLFCLNKSEDEIRKPIFVRTENKGWKIASGLEVLDFNGTKVEDLVRMLSDVTVVRYLNTKPPPPESYRLDGKKTPLKFEITIGDGKDKVVRTLVVGAQQEKDGPYYGTCDELPGVVFLLPREQFEPLVTGLPSVASFFSKS